ncbi:MAG: hypothetical protein JXB24_04885 [Bacteroidales bacterium]|nr:hypothetical protein [Bacteroidales bacterium]
MQIRRTRTFGSSQWRIQGDSWGIKGQELFWMKKLTGMGEGTVIYDGDMH